MGIRERTSCDRCLEARHDFRDVISVKLVDGKFEVVAFDAMNEQLRDFLAPLLVLRASFPNLPLFRCRPSRLAVDGTERVGRVSPLVFRLRNLCLFVPMLSFLL